MGDRLKERMELMGKMGYNSQGEESEVQMMNDEIIRGRIKDANEIFIVLKKAVDGKDEVIFCHAIAKIR